ncbi:MAG TPA: hypothetical protein VFX78_13530 [Candidatus Eisenbacteria bacterium]|nr:hypothetical protein [Candidatus Eisenbacteria bacterium]
MGRRIPLLWPALLAVVVTACQAPGSNASKSEKAPATAAAAKPAPAAMGKADAHAAQIAKELTDAMGGQSTWDNLPCFRFDFVAVRDGKEVARFQHWWDKKNSRCRVEGPDDQGHHVVAIFNLGDRKGISFTDGVPDADAATVKGRIQNGYERWVNDTYWVMMPFKLRDPGANLKYDRQAKGPNGEVWDVLALSFDSNVGLTPQDHYWLYVNQKTHLVDKWEMLLTGSKPPPSSASWESWTQVGPVRLSLLRRFEGRPVMLRFENAAAPDHFDESVFTFSKVRTGA